MEQPELIARAETHESAIAMRCCPGEYTYRDLLDRSASCAGALLESATDLNEARVAYLVPAGIDYVAAQWGIWRAGGIAVPLSLSATEMELEYTLSDSQSSVVATTSEHVGKIQGLCERLNLKPVVVDQAGPADVSRLPEIDRRRSAMILYTSGTTSKPKGVVSTHANIQAQIESLVKAWKWQSSDSIPLFLPLHHIHGIINILSCALWTGAAIEPQPHFDMKTIIDRVADGAYTLFMAVPTIYVKLIQAIESLPEEERIRAVNGFAQMRLMVSGSAALPASVHEHWTALTTQKLLERYGMTEIGMALSNPYDGERRPGAVGQPLPGVEVRLKSETGNIVTQEQEPGEIQVRGESVFAEYWNRPQATAESFEEENWFRTGDIAVLDRGYYRIMGRQSVDIIKSGGYKLSALEIESVLLDHPAIDQCAVVGVEDETWGEAVAAVVVLVDGKKLDLESLRSWSRDLMSHYKVPKRLMVVESLPRNAMGKVQKPAVRALF